VTNYSCCTVSWPCVHLYTYRVAFRSDVRNTYMYFRNVIFRGIIATEKYCFAQLLLNVVAYIPYRIGAFSRRHGKLSGILGFHMTLQKWRGVNSKTKHSYQSESIVRFMYYLCVWWQIHGISYYFLTPVQHKHQYIWGWSPVRFTV
jgi:hypothetical protein